MPLGRLPGHPLSEGGGWDQPSGIRLLRGLRPWVDWVEAHVTGSMPSAGGAESVERALAVRAAPS